MRHVVVLAFVVIAALSCAKLAGRAERLSGDHMSYYVAARSLLDGENPYRANIEWYRRYVYPPVFAWAIGPLTLAGPRAYALIWWALLGACWIAAYALVARILGGPRRAVHPAVVALPALLLARPIYNGWGLGQITSPLMVALLLALLALRRGRATLGGAVLGLAAAVKLFPAYLSLVFVRMRRLAPVKALVRTAALVSALPALTLGVPLLADYLFAWFPATAAVSIESQKLMPNRFSPVTSLWREMGWDFDRIGPAHLAWTAFCSLVLLAAGVPRRQRAFWLWCGLAITTMLLVSPMVQTNYLAFLWFPFAAMLHVAEGRPPGCPLRRSLPVAVVGSSLLFTAWSPAVMGPLHRVNWLASHGLVEAGLLLLWGAQLDALRVLSGPAGAPSPRAPRRPRWR
jgi:hypothetical protein